jgi:hypothetical protein
MSLKLPWQQEGTSLSFPNDLIYNAAHYFLKVIIQILRFILFEPLAR